MKMCFFPCQILSLTNSLFQLCYHNCNNLHRLFNIPTLPKYTVGSVPGHCLHVCLRVTFFFFFFFFFFFLQNAPIPMIFDDAIIYLFFLHLISMSKSYTKTIQKMGERNEKKTLQQQTNTCNYHTSNVI